MQKIILLVLVSFSVLSLKAQIIQDSLYTIWQDDAQTDSIRARAYVDYIYDGMLFNKPDSAFVMAKELLTFASEKQYPRAKAYGFYVQAISFYLRGNYPQALDYYQRSLKISEEIEYINGIANSLTSIGNVYEIQGKFTLALNCYQRGLKINEESGNKNGIATSLTNIGKVYQGQGKTSKALKYYQRGLKFHDENEDKSGVADLLVAIGSIYSEQGNNAQALDYYQHSLKIGEEIEDNTAIRNSLFSIGSVYSKQGNNALAMDYYQRSLKIDKETGNRNGAASSLSNIGLIYIMQGRYHAAISVCYRALKLGKEIGAIYNQKNSCSCLYKVYKAMGNGNEALSYYEQMNILEDSLNAEETNKNLQQMEFQKQVLKDSLKQEAEKLKVEMVHKEEVTKKDKTRNILIGTGLISLLLAGGFLSRWRYVKKSKDKLSKEKDRSDNLLLNILPAEIAEELKLKGSADAQDFDQVSILFTDFKEFTQMSEKLSAKDLVAEINHCFKAFDGVCEKYGVEKIKTIGDSYMAAGGLPVPNTNSTRNMVLAALEMTDFIINRKAERDSLAKEGFQMRAGIHTGNVVAGIVGVKKFQYDIWGDTVNTASRMESNGEVGKVNISQMTYEALKDDPQFSFQFRGKVEAKGKGEIEMYFVSLS